MSIVLLNEDNLPQTAQEKYGQLPRAFLIGAQRARTNQGYSSLTSNQDWRLNIYRHPSRHNSEANARFSIAFNVYSLGVVLVELGLWGLPHLLWFVSMKEFQKGESLGLDKKLKMLVSCSTPDKHALERGIHCSVERKYREVVESFSPSLTSPTSSLISHRLFPTPPPVPSSPLLSSRNFQCLSGTLTRL
jgi:hypothetical protein